MSESHEEVTVDEIKRKDGSKSKKDKKDKKDKGYMIFEEEDSAEELCESLTKTQSKSKKTKPFKFAKKEKKERSEKKKQDEKEKKPSKESKKEGKTKWKKKILPKSGEYAVSSEPDEQKAVFGVPLALAVERNPSHDGILLPAVVRECIDYISEYGLACEGIYRVSGVKSKVTQLKEFYNTGATVYLVDHEPNVVASLLKLFLRELPEPVLTTKLVPKFEQASATKNVKQQVEQFLQLIQELPPANRTLLSWVIVHMTHVIEKEKFNKMSLQNVSIVLSPTMKISHRVLNVLFTYSSILFRDTIIKKYVPPLKPATSRWALDLPECPSAIEEELKKQESLLNHMHEELMRVNDHRKEEELWEVQRIVTQLKRKLKHLRQMEQAPTKSDISLDKKQSFSSQKSWSHVPHGHHESSSKISLESSSADLSKVQDKLDRLSLSGDQTKLEAGVKLRSKDHLRGSEKKHHTPEAYSRKKMLHGDGSTKRHSSSASERSSRADKADVPSRTSLDKADNNLGIPQSKGISSEPIVEGKQVGDDKKEEYVAEPEEIVDEVRQEGDSARDLKDVRESNDVIPVTHETSPPEEDSVIGDESNDDSKPDFDLDQGTSVDRRPSLEQQEVRPTESQEVVVEQSQAVESVIERSQQVDAGSYKSVGDDASEDSSDPYTDVAEDDDDDGDDDDSDKKSSPQKRGDADDNDYEVLGEEEEHPSPLDPNRAMAVQGSLVTAEDSTFAESSEESSEGDEFTDHGEMFEKLLEEYNCLMMEEEELLAIGNELRQKIETERNEIERLQQDISELHMMRHDDAFETSSSSSSLSSYSSGSFDDDVTTDGLKELLLKHQQENAKLERDNAELCEKIHQERMACLGVKVQNRMIQQKQLHANVDLIDFE